MHRSNVASVTRNVGWFDQNWRYDYEVTWFAGNASIREVKIDKTSGAEVSAPLRPVFAFPPLIRDPRIDLRAPTGWTLVTRPTQFEFMIQPPPLGPLANFIPPLAGPPFAPAVGGPVGGTFRVYSVENPAPFDAFTIDHRNARFPAAPNAFTVDAPNHKIECAKITASCFTEADGFRYSYTISSEIGEIWQGIVFLEPTVDISSIHVSDPTWQTYRPGFDKPIDRERADGTPTDDETGVLYFGTWLCPVTRDGLSAVSMSFFSKSPPGGVLCLANKFEQLLLGPTNGQSMRKLSGGGSCDK